VSEGQGLVQTHCFPSTRPGQGGTSKVCAFAKLPHDIASDPRLKPVDVRVLAALLFWARDKPTCYPSDRSIGARVHRARASIQRALRRLEGLGFIAREKTESNVTGRLIRLLFVAGPSEAPCLKTGRAPVSKPAPDPVSRVGQELRRGEIKEKPAAGDVPDGTGSPPPARPEPEPDRPAEDDWADVTAWLSEGPGHPLYRSAVRRFAAAGLALPKGVVSNETPSAPTPTAPHAFTAAGLALPNTLTSNEVIPSAPTPTPTAFTSARGWPGRVIGRHSLGDALAAVASRPRRPRLPS
jgi:hypothetical protein